MNFIWKCEPQAENLLLNFLNECVASHPGIKDLQEELRAASSRLFDWVEYFTIGAASTEIEKDLKAAGFIQELSTTSHRILHHPRAQLPRVLILPAPASGALGIAVKVESISDYLMVRGLCCKIEGSPLSPFRRCCVSSQGGVSLWVVERRGSLTMEPAVVSSHQLQEIVKAAELWQLRPRRGSDEAHIMKQTITLAEELVRSVGKDYAAHLMLEGERKYWQSRNTAGQIQKNRQDRVGLGWANHDHHTFRSSRRNFPMLVKLFETVGFHCRERFYAGEEAGWGAQVMEQSNSGLVLFLDIDLAPNEHQIDFAHITLPELKHLGTIGLWCALHGESILQAGMHHLEAQFFFDELGHDLAKVGIGMMVPFSNFPHLRQAFTVGEQWSVDPSRVHDLLKRELVTQAQAEKFIEKGAIGSHLENLQRRQGFKGFNQHNISQIIQETDPRSIATTTAGI